MGHWGMVHEPPLRDQSRMPTFSSMFQPRAATAFGRSDHDDRAIEQELALTCQTLNLTATVLPPKEINQVIAATTRRLFQSGRYADGLRLASAVPQRFYDNAPHVMARVRCLRALDEMGALIAEIDRVLARPNADPALETHLIPFITRAHLSWLIAPCPRLLPQLGPPPPETIEELIAGHWPNLDKAVISNADSIARYKAITQRILTVDDDQILLKSAEVAHKITLIEVSRIVTETGPMAAHPFAPTFRRLFVDLARDNFITDVDPLTASIAAGRSIVIQFIHTGRLPLPLALGELGVPPVVISRPDLAYPGWTAIRTREPTSLAFAFLRVAKAMKKAPHLLVVFPDAPDGGEFDYLPFRGHFLRVGVGASMLAHLRETQLFTVAIEYQDGRALGKISSGPIVGPHMSREEVRAVFSDTYKGAIAALIDGPLVNLGNMQFMQSVLDDDPTQTGD